MVHCDFMTPSTYKQDILWLSFELGLADLKKTSSLIKTEVRKINMRFFFTNV